MEKILTGIRVLDFTHYLAGPYAATLLGDMGAEVIKIERPGGSVDRELGPYAPNGESLIGGVVISRNKRGVTLNLRSEKGKEMLQGLVSCSDVVLHNFPSSSQEAKTLAYESLKKINPAIILMAVSGFGSTGPYAGRPAFDSIAQALSGGMTYTGFPGNPPVKAAINWVDYSTAINAALGIMLALYHRSQTGKGQMIDLAMLDVAVTALGICGVAAEYQLLGFVRPQVGNNSFYNFSNSFQAKDGWVMISAPGNHLWDRLLKVIGREDLKDDPRFKDDMTRGQNRDITEPIISEWTKERTTNEIMEAMREARVPCDQINNVPQMIEHPQVKAREALVEVEYPDIGNVLLPGMAIKMSETPGTIERRAPKVGEHNQEVYGQLLGLSPQDVSQLEAEGVI